MALESRIPRPAGGRFIQVHAWAIKAVGFAAAAVLGELDFLDRAQELPGQILASRARVVADLEGMVGRNAVHSALVDLVGLGWVNLHLITQAGEKNITTTHHYSLNAPAIAEFLTSRNREARNPEIGTETGKPEIPKSGSQKSRNRDRNREALGPEGEREIPCATRDSGDQAGSAGGHKKENVVLITTTPTEEGSSSNSSATTTDPQGDGESVPADGSSGVAGAGGQVEVEFEDNIKHLAAEIFPLLNKLDQATKQNLMDELSGGIAAAKNPIQNPVGWVRRMVKQVKGEAPGGFTPAYALEVRKARESRKAAEARKQQEEAARLADSARMVEEGRAMTAAAGATSTREALWRVIGKHPPTPTT